MASSIVLVAPAFAHYLRLQSETGFERSLDDAAMYSAYFRSYLASAAHAHNWLLPIIKDWNHEVLFPGFLSLVFGAIGIGAIASTPPAPGRTVPGDRETTALYASLVVLSFWASLGPRAGLYTLLFKTIPVFSLLRAPGRTGIVVALVLAIFSAFGVRTLGRRRAGRASAAIAVACCGAALLELSMIPIAWREAPAISPTYDVLARMPRGAVAEFPFYEQRIDFHIHTVYMLNSTRHWQPLLNGYSDYIPPDFRELALVLASFPSRESFVAMRRRRTRYIVIHRDLYGAARAPEIEARLQLFMPYLDRIAADDRMQIFEIKAWPDGAVP